MTTQIKDRVYINEQCFYVMAVSDGEIFSPQSQGLNPVVLNTANIKGFRAIYSVSEGALYLNNLDINLLEATGEDVADIKDAVGPELFGIHPSGRRPGLDWFNNHYQGLFRQVEFTGGLILGGEYIEDLVMNCENDYPLIHYSKVYEMLLDKGVIKGCIDISEKIERLRQILLSACLENAGEESNNEFEIFLNSLSRSYSLL